MFVIAFISMLVFVPYLAAPLKPYKTNEKPLIYELPKPCIVHQNLIKPMEHNVLSPLKYLEKNET